MSATKLTTALLLSSLLATSHAFVPVDAQPIPSELDPNLWSPLTTLMPITGTSPSPTITPSASAEVRILTVPDDNVVPDLKRQVTGQGAATAVASNADQISPVTTYYINSMKDGSAVQVPVVYTQTFVAVPDQWSSPTSGEIGLGTITGTIGVVKTKRSLPTQAPMAEKGPETGDKNEDTEDSTTSLHPFLSKLKGAAQHLKDELVALMDKEDHNSSTGDVKVEMIQAPNSDESSRSSTAEDSTIVDSSEEAGKAYTKSVLKNDAGRALRAGTLAVLAVGLATTCATYLSF